VSKSLPHILFILAIAAVVAFGRGLPDWGGWLVATKPDAVTFVFEKDSNGPSAPVMSALNKLNRSGILATSHEIDTLDGTSEIPDQYKHVVPAAKEAGLPALVVSGNGKVIRVLKDPKTEEAVIEAAK
jgi:pyruvate carboxylase